MQTLEGLSQERAVKDNSFTHLDRSGVVVEAHDYDLFTHDLLKPAPMPAGENGVPPEKVTQDDRKAHDG